MIEHGMIYGIRTLQEWERRVRISDRKAMLNLRDTKDPAGKARLGHTMQVASFTRLVDVTAFLSVMNKNHILLYRGQTKQRPLLPSLFRPKWTPPDGTITGHIRDGDRRGYWNTLEEVESRTLAVLEDEGLPRWRHLKFRRPARWAVIQHYELWPTPLLDFTTSIRVAASFAFGLDQKASAGFLYVIGVKRVRSDLMTLDPKENGDGDKAERESGTLAIRLNAVCPPSAVRPHLQDGVLIGHYPSDQPLSYDAGVHDAASLLVAKLHLTNDGGFWTRDFPILRRTSLLPKEKDDRLLRSLRSSIRHEADPSGKLVLAG